MWIFRHPTGFKDDVDYFLKRQWATTGKSKYLEPTLITVRSKASRFITEEAAQNAGLEAGISGKVERY